MKKVSYKVLAVICDESWGGSLRPGLISSDFEIQDESWEVAARLAVSQAIQVEMKECHMSNHRVRTRVGGIKGATNYPKVCCQDGLFEVALQRVAEPITLVSVDSMNIGNGRYRCKIQIPCDQSCSDMKLSVKQAVEQDMRSGHNLRWRVVGVAYFGGFYAVSVKHDEKPDIGTILLRNEDYEEGEDD
jgi:hypothetical protein